MSAVDRRRDLDRRLRGLVERAVNGTVASTVMRRGMMGFSDLRRRSRAPRDRIANRAGRRRASLMLLAATLSAAALAHGQTAPQDPFAWLEDIHSPRALAWVQQQNSRTAARLERDPRFAAYRDQALAIFTATDRLPTPVLRAGGVDNLWQDAANPHGLWRRSSLASFNARRPQWETLLDLDALSKAEGKSWFWKGADCLPPEETHCLVRLSDGGGDSVEVREFDASTKHFAPSGFSFATARQNAAWIDKDTVIVGFPWTPGQTTASGYPTTLKLLRRGRALGEGSTVLTGETSDGGGVGIEALRDPDGTLKAMLATRSISDYNVSYFLLTPGRGAPLPLDLPRKSQVHAYAAGQLAFTIQEDWKGFRAGDLLSYDLTPPGAAPRLIFRPTPHQSIDQVAAARNRLLVVILQDVTGEALDFSYASGRWTSKTLALPKLAAVTLTAASPASNVAFLTSAGFLDPTSLWLCDADAATTQTIKTLPAQFDAARDVVEQFWAVSKDGARIPYFLVRPRAMKADGSTPTQMFGYGGFLISELPAYRPELGKLWLEKGGAYVLANIRGGGEFGPAWHDAALRDHRQRAFDDFAAVALDLFARKITSPRRLGIYGRSNGGVLTSVSMTQHPDYWNAAVIESPLVDMLRYNHLSAGASWTGEYGDPDLPADRAFIARYSAYQLLKKGVRYPEPYITTNTQDDRVHPGHARKLAAKLESLGAPYLYYEDTFGGHSNDAAPELNARRWARHYVYLSQKLMD